MRLSVSMTGGVASLPAGCMVVLSQHRYKEQRPPLTFSPIRTGWIPKNGLMAIAGTMGAPSSAGRGAMQTPPVSGGDRNITPL